MANAAMLAMPKVAMLAIVLLLAMWAFVVRRDR
jgi:hypothetical protein